MDFAWKLAGAAILLASCGGAGTETSSPPPPPPPPPAPVATLTLDRDTATIGIGATAQLAATLKDGQGTTLTGRPVSWSATAPSVASVSGTGLVTAVQVGQSKIVAVAEGKSDTAVIVVPPAPLQITLQAGASQTATIGPAGGTLAATGAGGTQYTLVIPPLALLQPVAITMTPLGSVTGLPLSGGFLAGADFQPSGLVFAQPATLTIATSSQPGANQHLVGFSYQGAGQALQLAPAKQAASSVSLPVLHFSGVGAGFGTAQDVEALWFGSHAPPSSSAFYAGALINASAANPQDGAFELQILEDWFDDLILPLLSAVSTDVQLLNAINAKSDWEETPDILGIYATIPGGQNAPSLQARRDQWMQALVPKVKTAIVGNLQLCAAPGLASARIAALDNAIFWHRLARVGFGIATAQNGLDLAWLQANLCARSVSENVTLANPLSNSTNTLDVTFKLIFTGGQLVIGANFYVSATASGATLGLPGATALTPPGFFTGTVTPVGSSGSVTIDLTACYAGPQLTAAALGGGNELCHIEHIARDRVPPVAPSYDGTYSLGVWSTDRVTGEEVSRSSAMAYEFYRMTGPTDYCLDGTGKPAHTCTALTGEALTSRGTLTGNTFTYGSSCPWVVTLTDPVSPSMVGTQDCPNLTAKDRLGHSHEVVYHLSGPRISH